MSQNKFEFRKEDHTYWLDGQQLLSATQIIKLCGLIDDRFYTEAARIRGTAVHAACHYLAERDLDRSSLDPFISGYVDAYEKVLLALECQNLTLAETPLFHPTLRYATTPDHLWDGRNLIEIKSGTMQPWTAIQTALQAMALDPNNYYRFHRIGVELHEDGSYRLESFTDPNDFNVAVGMVGVANWIFQNGGKKI